MKKVIFITCLVLSGWTFAGNVTLSTDIDLPAPYPDPNQEITVFVNSDAPLFFMNLLIHVVGDATITGVMDANDCSEYGWGPDFVPVSVIESDNSIRLYGLNWDNNSHGTVGYFTFKCNSSRVSVYLDDDSFPFSWTEIFTFSKDPILVGTLTLPPLKEVVEPQPVVVYVPPTEPNLPDRPAGEISDWMSVPQAAVAYETVNMLDAEPEKPIIEINSDITENTVWDANNVYYLTDANGINVQALLVIEPGTTILYGLDCSLYVNNGGTLISKGTPDKPIIYTLDRMYFLHHDYIGRYFYWMPDNGAYSYVPIYIESTASVLTTIQYSMIEGAQAAIVTENIRLTNPIENNFLSGNIWGIYEYGPACTDVKNNLCNDQYYASITFDLLPDPNIVGDTETPLMIEQNTCDDYAYYGIVIFGADDPNTVPIVHLTNNVVSDSYCGLYIDGWTRLLVVGTGYYNNKFNKNWEFDEYFPVESEVFPYADYIGLNPCEHHYLADDSPFVDAGAQYIEQTPFIGMTTNPNGTPDKDILDIGFHFMDWNYVGVEGVSGSNIDDLMEMSDYWLEYSPFEPNSPGYIDPNLYVVDPNHPENWIDPNFVSYGGDWNGNGIVDYQDFSLLAATWQEGPDEPNIVPTLSFDAGTGWLTVSATGYNSDTVSVSAFIDGECVGKVYWYGNETPASVDISESGNLPHQLKFASIDSEGYIAWSGPTEFSSPSPLSYCILPSIYEPNEPIPFAAYNTGAGDATVEVYGNGEQLLWSQNFSGNSVGGSIPADFTSDDQIIDYVTFTSASGGSVSKTTFPKIEPGDIDFDVKALMIIPNQKLFDIAPQVRYQVLNAFIERGIKVKRFEGSQATWENVARYGQYGFVKYIYILAHGDYGINKGKDNEVLRTCIKLADCWAVSCKASEFTSPPSWCKPLPEPLESVVKTWASMNFDRLVFVYSDSCYGGRLKIDGTNNLVEGPSGAYGVTDFSQSDLTLMLGMSNTYESRHYHGWWGKGWAGIFYPDTPEATYPEWSKDVWKKMGEGRNLDEALTYAIEETTIHSDESAVMNYRLKGRGNITDIQLKK